MVEVRDDLTDAHVESLIGFYAETWFGDGWDAETIDGLLAGTDELVALADEESGALLAFAHVLTDYTTVAFVRDVVVSEDHRGDGLGRRLLTELRDHPELTGVDQFAVTCPDRLAPFYRLRNLDRLGNPPTEYGRRIYTPITLGGFATLVVVFQLFERVIESISQSCRSKNFNSRSNSVQKPSRFHPSRPSNDNA